MARKMLIDATHPEETRVVVANGNKVEEFDFDATSSELITGNIYLAKVSRIEPSLQAAFVEYGGNRHGFLAFSEIHPDYFQIPQADREALLKEALEAQAADEADEEREEAEQESELESSSKTRRSRHLRKRSNHLAESSLDEVVLRSDEIISESAEPINPATELKSEEPSEVTSVGDEATKMSDDLDNSVEGEESQTRDDTETLSTLKSRRTRSRKRSSKRSKASFEDPRDEVESEILNEIEPSPDDCEEITTSPEDEEEAQGNGRNRNVERVKIHQRYNIQEVIKVRQILLVQIIKEERSNKGAALTTYLSLPGRYCVLMPNTARGGGISRKISNIQDRKRLKSLAKSFNVPKGAGLIIRTAGASKESDEIRRDYEFLTRQWNQIRELTLKSIAPATVYAETGPVKRAIRDLLTNDCDEILIEGQEAYNEASEYVGILMPDRVKNVKLYQDSMPLFSRYQVESQLSSMFNPTVQLKSGGYLVIGITEALIAIDVNSGRSTKGASIEETAYKTNLEAAEEVARQLKLRDLAGLIVIDFIDMEQRRHQQDVENTLKDALRKDRARIQVGRISSFGLLEMSRQRLRTGLVEAITKPCPHCLGTGIQRSSDNVALSVIRAIEEEIARGRSNEIIAHVPMEIANYLFNEKRAHILGFDATHGVSVKIVADPEKISPNFELEKNTVQGKPLPQKVKPLILESTEDEEKSGKSKRRRRRSGRSRDKSENQGDQLNIGETTSTESGETMTEQSPKDLDAEINSGNEATAKLNEKVPEKPKRKSRSRRATKRAMPEDMTENVNAVDKVEAGNEEPKSQVEKLTEVTSAEKPAKPKPRARKKTAEAVIDQIVEPETIQTKPKPRRSKKASASETVIAIDQGIVDLGHVELGNVELDKVETKPKRKARSKVKTEAPETVIATASDATMAEPVVSEKAAPKTAEAEPSKPKRKGWWSL